jgi:hypothetical protein
MSLKPIVPRNWETMNAATRTGKTFLVVRVKFRGKLIPAFNGSLISRRNKKRPITLPKHA